MEATGKVRTRPCSRAAGICLAGLLATLSTPAGAQAFPSKPINMIVAFPAGGPSDLGGSPLELILTPLGMSAAKNKPEDVRMIARVGNTAMALVTRKDLGVNSVEELVAMMKKADKPLSYASVGIGSLYHLMAEKFVQSAGAKGLHVPYNGMAPALNDLLGGQVAGAFADVAAVMGQIKAGRVKALGVHAVLVGESLLRQENLEQAAKILAEAGQ